MRSPGRAASGGGENLTQGLQVPSALGEKSTKHFGNALVQVRHLKLTRFPLDNLSASLSTSQLIDLQEPQHLMVRNSNSGLHAAGETR